LHGNYSKSNAVYKHTLSPTKSINFIHRQNEKIIPNRLEIFIYSDNFSFEISFFFSSPSDIYLDDLHREVMFAENMHYQSKKSKYRRRIY
jgi:hypothetical protein